DMVSAAGTDGPDRPWGRCPAAGPSPGDPVPARISNSRTAVLPTRVRWGETLGRAYLALVQGIGTHPPGKFRSGGTCAAARFLPDCSGSPPASPRGWGVGSVP